MSLEPDFSSAEFRALNQQQQIAKCREMASEALRLASNGKGDMRAEYTDLAARWSELAEEMEKAQIEPLPGFQFNRL